MYLVDEHKFRSYSLPANLYLNDIWTVKSQFKCLKFTVALQLGYFPAILGPSVQYERRAIAINFSRYLKIMHFQFFFILFFCLFFKKKLSS